MGIDRRTILKQLALGVPAGLLLPTWLSSCKNDDDPGPRVPYDGNVVIIGAGIAGIYTGFLLKDLGIDVTILEASDQHGGRIRSLNTFTDFPMELGADEVRGTNSTWYDLIETTGIPFAEGETSVSYFLDNSLVPEVDAAEDADLAAALQFLENLSSYNGADVTVAQAIANAGLSSRVIHILEALIGGENGTNNDRLGIRGVAEARGLWTAGDDIVRLRGREHLSIFNSAFNTVISDIQYNTVVQSIDYSTDMIEIRDTEGNAYTGTIVVVAVPLSVLKDGDISFAPSLPATKTVAISTLEMDPGMKIFLRFDTTFWGNELRAIYGDGMFPEYRATGVGRSTGNRLLTAQVFGEDAEALSDLTDEEVTNMAVADLDRLFGDTKPSEKINASFIMDWGKEPYIRGVNSYPLVGSGNQSREVISQQVNNKLFFAGEATNTNGHAGTVHGAMESAERVLNEILTLIAPDEVDESS